MIDFTSAWMTGSVNSPKFIGNYSSFRYSINRFSQGEDVLYNGISIYSTYSTVNSGVSSSINLKKSK